MFWIRGSGSADLVTTWKLLHCEEDNGEGPWSTLRGANSSATLEVPSSFRRTIRPSDRVPRRVSASWGTVGGIFTVRPPRVGDGSSGIGPRGVAGLKRRNCSSLGREATIETNEG